MRPLHNPLWRSLALIGAAALLGLAPPQPARHASTPSDYWGVALGLHPGLQGSHAVAFPPDVSALTSHGIRAVLLPVSRAQHDVRSSHLLAGTDSVTRAQLQQVADASHDQGLHVALMHGQKEIPGPGK